MNNPGGVMLAQPSTSAGAPIGAFSFASPSQAPPIRPQLMQERTLTNPSELQPAPPAFQPYYLRPAYRFKPTTVSAPAESEDGPGRRLRRNLANVRRHVDYTANVATHIEARLWQRDWRDRRMGAPDLLYSRDILPASSWKERPIDCVLTKFLRAAMNKIKCPIYDICWTPEGRRLITGASTGEFTLWNGTAFNFETILQAHDTAIRALKWTHGEKWLVSADHDGFVKYWQANMNNVHMYQAHKEAVRSISFSCTDAKMCTGSDDGTVRVWDFNRCTEERILRGHGSDVRSVDWHPQKGLLASGSRDSQQPVKIWDAKTGQCLATLHDHKNSAMAVEWNLNGNWLLTASRDHLIKLYDIRMMREVRTFRGHKKEVTAVAWHPVHEGLFVSGGGDGSLAYWLATSDKEAGLIEHAHDQTRNKHETIHSFLIKSQAIWTLEWHPLGHILASGSNDNNTKFWTRNKPGDTTEDFHGMISGPVQGGTLSGPNSTTHMRDKVPETPSEKLARQQALLEAAAAARAAAAAAAAQSHPVAPPPDAVIPGMGLDKDTLESLKKAPLNVVDSPGLGATLFPDNPIPQETPSLVGAKKTLIKQPPPKKTQRQMERLWNPTRPMGSSESGFAEHGAELPSTATTAALSNPAIADTGATKRGKKSLLGRAPPPGGPPPPSMRPGPPGGWPAPSAPPGGPVGYGGPPGPPARPPMPPPGPPPPRLYGQPAVPPAPPPPPIPVMMGMGGMGSSWPSASLPSQAPPIGAPSVSRDVDYRYQATAAAPVAQPSAGGGGDTDMRGWAGEGSGGRTVDEEWRSAGAAAIARDPRQRRKEEAPAPPPLPRDPRARRAQQSNVGGEEEVRKRNWMGSYAELSQGGIDLSQDSPIPSKFLISLHRSVLL